MTFGKHLGDRGRGMGLKNRFYWTSFRIGKGHFTHFSKTLKVIFIGKSMHFVSSWLFTLSFFDIV